MMQIGQEQPLPKAIPDGPPVLTGTRARAGRTFPKADEEDDAIRVSPPPSWPRVFPGL
jgi:hypothetical protein